MKQNKKVLGKGLGALLGDIPETGSLKIQEINIEKIEPNPEQPRKNFTNISELRDSIKVNGVLQPILVLRKGDKYEIIAGERRWKAASEAGLKKIPAIIKENLDDEKKLEFALIENVQRENLNPIEEASAYKFLINKFNMKIDDLAKKLGKNRSTISNTLRLLKLPTVIIQDLKNGVLTSGQVRPLIGLESRVDILKLRDKIIKGNLSSRDTEKLTRSIKKRKTAKKLDVVLNEIRENVQSVLSTKVNIQGSLNKGKIIIEYYTQDDLERINEFFNKE